MKEPSGELSALPDWVDRYKASQMVQLRALGYNQAEIAEQVGVSQATVSRYLSAVNEVAQQSKDQLKFLLALFAIAAGFGLAAYLMKD